MRKFTNDERIPSRAAREQGLAEPLLTIEEQLDSVILELTRPIESAGKEITEIIISAPEPDDQFEFENRDGSNKDNTLRALTKSTGIPPDALLRLHLRDLNRLRDIYWAFGM